MSRLPWVGLADTGWFFFKTVLKKNHRNSQASCINFTDAKWKEFLCSMHCGMYYLFSQVISLYYWFMCYCAGDADVIFDKIQCNALLRGFGYMPVNARMYLSKMTAFLLSLAALFTYCKIKQYQQLSDCSCLYSPPSVTSCERIKMRHSF